MCLVVGDSFLVVYAAVQGDVDTEGQESHGVVEKILGQFGMTSSETVNLLFAEIDRCRAIPFTVSLKDNSDIAPPVERVAETLGKLDRDDFSHLIRWK